MTLATSIYSTHAQESVPVSLNGNYRKPQLADSRVVLVSFKEGKYGLQSGLALMFENDCKGCINDIATELL